MIQFHLDVIQIVSFLVAVVSPLLVGLVTTRLTSSAIKAWLLAGIAAITGLGSEFIQTINEGGVYDLGAGIISAVTAFVIAVGMHYGIYKPTGTSEALQDVGTKNTQ